MGAWGDGIYENDTASDYAVELAGELLNEARRYIESDELDRSNHSFIMPMIDVINYLCERADCHPFTGRSVLTWKTRMLTSFDDARDDYQWTDEEMAESRVLLVELFDRFEKFILVDRLAEDWAN